MTHPDAEWVDHHLLLNSMSVLRHRMATSSGESTPLLDAISGYLSSGLYIGKRSSVARVSWLLDWIECLAQVCDSVDPHGSCCQVCTTIDGDEDRVALLSHAFEVTRALFVPAAADGSRRFWKVDLRLSEDRLHFGISGSDAGLHARLQALIRVAPGATIRMEDSATPGLVTCSALLPSAGELAAR